MAAAACTGSRPVAHQPALELRGAERATGHGQGRGDEESDGIRQAYKWFFGQRAYPKKEIPFAALRKARHQAGRLPETRIPRTKRPTSGPNAGPLVTPTWQAVGSPSATSTGVDGADDLYSGASPFGGRVTAVAPVGDGATTYVGTAEGGVWKTTNSGTTWTPVFDTVGSGPAPSLAIGAITVDPNDSTHVWVGTGEPNQSLDSYYGAGLFESVDGGSTWSQVAGPTDSSVDQFVACDISAIGIKAGDSNTILVGTTSLQGIPGKEACSKEGLWQSTDGGSSWGTDPVLAGPVSDLKPATATTWYAGIDGSPKSEGFGTTGGVYKSTDSGASWGSPLGSGRLPSSNFGRVSVAVAPSHSPRVYAAFENFDPFGGATDGDLKSIWTSSNAGNSWNFLAKPTGTTTFCDVGGGGQCWYDMVLAVDPTTPTTLYGGGINLWKWDISSSVSASPTLVAAGSNGIHVDTHALSFDSGGNLWAGNDGGIYRSTSLTTPSFDNLNATLGALQFYPGLANASLSGTTSLFVGGTQDNGTLRSYSTMNPWNRINGGDGGFAGIDPNTTGTTNASTLYASLVDAEVLKSTNGGVNFHDIFLSNDPAEFIAPFVVSPSSASTLYVGTNHLYRSKNAGASFASISPAFGSGFGLDCCITAIAPAPSNSHEIYVGTGGGRLEVSTDGGSTWTNTRPHGLPHRFVTDIAVDPAHPATAYVTVSGFGTYHVFKTTNSGGTWTPVSGDLPDSPANAIAVDWSTSPATLYAGTDVGVFTSSDGGTNWATYGTGLPPVVVMDLVIDPGSARLVAATHGRGVYSIQAAGLSPSAGTMQFTSPTYSVTEGAGHATIAVSRIAGTAAAASVHYATSNGTATAGHDYRKTSGTLSWSADAGGSKKFTVPIINDTKQEAGESVHLTLSNRVGATLGFQKTATLTIVDNDKPAHQPDLRIKRSGGSYVGNNVYNTTGRNQTVSVSGARRTKKVLYFIPQNDGRKSDWFRITGSGNSKGFKIKYFQGSTLIASGALNTRLGSPSHLVPPGREALPVKIVITITSKAAHGERKTVTIVDTSQKQRKKQDVAKGKVSVK